MDICMFMYMEGVECKIWIYIYVYVRVYGRGGMYDNGNEQNNLINPVLLVFPIFLRQP